MTAGVLLCDVGPRDGLQNEPGVVPPERRARLVDDLARAGLRRVEAASFVSPRLVPQMAGAEDVFAACDRTLGAQLSGLVLNERGLERALASGAELISMSYPVTDSFAQRNQATTAEGGAQTAARVIEGAHAAGLGCVVTLSVCFGCPFEGEVDPGVVIDHVRRLAEAGADEIVLADTIGVGVPSQVRRLVPAALEAAPGRPIGLHLHDTRNTAIANVDAGLACGATVFDASVAGIGGCPFAPDASGNVATEDVVFLLERSGIATGVDLDALIAVARDVADLLGRQLPGQVYRAGPFAPLSL